MLCPFCGFKETKVIDSRLAHEGSQIRRRRECLSCKARCTTFEQAELSLPRVIKRKGNRVPFCVEKLRAGLLKALEKRAVSVEQVEAALSRIIHQVRTQGEQEILAIRIGELVMNELKKLDQVAYVRFASVYRAFEDVSDFKEEIERLEEIY